MKQPRFLDVGDGGHDSIQYHFFSKDLFFAARVFRTDSLDHCSAWLFDGRTRELLSQSDRMKQSDKDHLDISSPTMQIMAQDQQGIVLLKGYAPSASIQAKFTVRHEFTWLDPGGQIARQSDSVIHQPDLEAEITIEGRILKARGYCKRYIWIKTPRYCEWDFYHCASRDGGTFMWTADATFGDAKYNYFKLFLPDTPLQSANENQTYHAQNSAYGKIGADWYEASFSEIGKWQHAISSAQMDGMLRQRFGSMIISNHKGFTIETDALHENFIGTIG